MEQIHVMIMTQNENHHNNSEHIYLNQIITYISWNDRHDRHVHVLQTFYFSFLHKSARSDVLSASTREKKSTQKNIKNWIAFISDYLQ